MTPAETLASILPFVVLFTALFRARLLAPALVPPCLLILARWTGLVDISSASHPLRFLVPMASLSLAMWAAWRYARRVYGTYKAIQWLDNMPDEWHVALANLRSRRMSRGGGPSKKTELRYHLNIRALVASILVFASGCADIPALLAWQLPGEWALVPLQIAVCLVILVVLLAPERWFAKCFPK